MRNILTAAAAAALMLAATGANALTYAWSFNATGGTSLGPVTGTISGLSIGRNDGPGMIVNVLSSPSGNALGGGWTLRNTQMGGEAFTVDASRNVIFADAFFEISSLGE